MITCHLQRIRSVSRCGKFWMGVFVVAVIVASMASCATVGREFPESQVSEIQIGETTQTQIRDMFGTPWRVGVEDGQPTWTYGRYHYKLFGQANTKDLVIRFNEKGVVVSYSFNTTDHQE